MVVNDDVMAGSSVEGEAIVLYHSLLHLIKPQCIAVHFAIWALYV